MKKLHSIIIVTFALCCAGCITQTDPQTGEVTRTIDAQRVADVADTASRAVDDYVPGAAGDLISGTLGLFAAGAAYYARRKSKQATTSEHLAQVKENALKSTVAAIEIFKNQGTPAQKAAIEQLVPFLVNAQNTAGADARAAVRDARNAVTDGAESNS